MKSRNHKSWDKIVPDKHSSEIVKESIKEKTYLANVDKRNMCMENLSGTQKCSNEGFYRWVYYDKPELNKIKLINTTTLL